MVLQVERSSDGDLQAGVVSSWLSSPLGGIPTVTCEWFVSLSR